MLTLEALRLAISIVAGLAGPVAVIIGVARADRRRQCRQEST